MESKETMTATRTRAATLSDVAKRAGVSINAVSSVVNRSRVGTRVSEETRGRIQAAAAELEYHPNAAARRLSGKRTGTLGVVFYRAFQSPFSSAYFAPILDGIGEAASQHRQDMMLFTGHHWEDAQHSLPFFCDGRCDGLLLIGPHTATDIVGALLDRQVPFTLINNRWEDPRASWVDVDDVAAAAAMTSYLLDVGHRKIALLCGEFFVQCVPRRIEGYRQAFAAHGLAADPAMIVSGSFMPPSTATRVAALLAQPASIRPTALFCMNDVMATEALKAISEHGLRVPEDISVVGFDDTAPNAAPLLTTVRQPLPTLGMRAVELLLAQIDSPDGEIQTGGTDIQPTELIIRYSSRPL